MVRGLPAVFILVAWFTTTAAFAESDAAFTGIEKLSEAAFPSHSMLTTYDRPSEAEAKAVEAYRDASIRLILEVGPAWFSKVAGTAGVNQVLVRKALVAIKRTPVWLCRGRCRSCSKTMPGGCAITRKFGGEAVSVITLHSCLLHRGSCQGISDDEKAPWPNVVRTMEQSLGMVAYASLSYSEDADRARRAAIAGMDALSQSLAVMEAMAAACPGPFPQSGEGFLIRTGHLTELNLFAEKCAAALVAPLRRTSVPPACQAFWKSDAFKKRLPKDFFVADPRAYRCDEFCGNLLCQKDPRVPQLLRFGEKWMMAIPEGACEGASPIDPKAFILGIIREYGDPGKLRDPGYQAMAELCAASLSRGLQAAPGTESVVPSEHAGPDVQLIED